MIDEQILNDNRADRVCTFFTDEQPELVEELKEFVLNDKHRLINNYHNIEWDKFPFISTFKVDGKITGYSTGWARDFFPKDSIRLVNRFYLVPERRSKVHARSDILMPPTLAMIDQQIGFSDQMGFKYKFISREVRAPRHFEILITDLGNRSINSWEYRRGPYLCAPDPDNSECWQSIGLSTKHDATPFWDGLRKWK